jgi:hypothetical protein
METQKTKTGRPQGSKSIAGNRKEIRQFMARMARDFESNFKQMTPAEKNDVIIRYLNGEI